MGPPIAPGKARRQNLWGGEIARNVFVSTRSCETVRSQQGGLKKIGAVTSGLHPQSPDKGRVRMVIPIQDRVDT